MNGVQFINGYKPVDTYYNGRQVAGSKLIDISGETLGVNNTYDDAASLNILGKTIETGAGIKSPTNPYALHSVTSFDVVSAGKKNLFDKSKITISTHVLYNGVVVEWSNSDWAISDYLHILPNGTYKWSGRPNSSSQAETAFYTKDKVYISKANGMGISFTTPPTAYYYRCNTAVVDLDTAQLELGSTATPYTPFRGVQTIHFPYTLRSLPNGTCDKIIIDHINKTAILREETIEITFNSSSQISGSGDAYFIFPNNTGLKPNTGSLESSVCSHEVWNNITNIYSKKTGIGVHSSSNYIWWHSPYFAGWDIPTFGIWLDSEIAAGRPVILIGERVTPIETPLDYEEVKTFYPYTQIYITSTITPTLEGKIRIYEEGIV